MNLPFLPPGNLVFEPYLSLFTLASATGAVVGLASGVAAHLTRLDWRWKAALFLPAAALAFALALAVQAMAGLVWPRLGGGLSWAALGQSSVGFLFGWALWAMVGTYIRIFERSGRPLTWGLLALRLGGILLLAVILANPVWKRQDVDPGRVVVVLDDSRSMSLPHPDGGSRYDHAVAAVDRLKHALESAPDSQGRRVAVDLYDIAGAHLDAPPPAPNVDQTDLTHALDEALLKARGSHLVAGVVLVSDGMDTTGRKDLGAWGGESVPFYGLGFPDTANGDLNLAVTATDPPKTDPPKTALIHNALPVRITVRKTGAAAADATVALKLGTAELTSQKVHFAAGDHETVVPLTWTPDQAGEFDLTASVETDAAEPYLGDNALQLPIRVDAEPINVLYAEGYLRFESKYLKERLQDDPDVTLSYQVRPDNPEGGGARTEFFTDERLKSADVVILGDMEGRFLSPAEHQRLKDWLDQKNHSLLVLGGYRSFGPDGFRDTPLADLLPVVFASGATQSEEPVHLRLTEPRRGGPDEASRHADLGRPADRSSSSSDAEEDVPALLRSTGCRGRPSDLHADRRPRCVTPRRGQGQAPLAGHVPGCLRLKSAAEELKAVNPAVAVDGKPAGGRGRPERRRAAAGVLVLTVDSTVASGAGSRGCSRP